MELNELQEQIKKCSSLSEINSIQEKIGKDASNLILDELGELLTDNKSVNDELSNKDKEIEKYKKTNETLQRVNGNLLQQVAMGSEEDLKPKTKEPEKPKNREVYKNKNKEDTPT